MSLLNTPAPDFTLPQDGGEMVVHSSTQHPTEIQHKVAEALGLPMRDVRTGIRHLNAA